jgi:REP element-mobilizing transposase RayT
MVQDLGHKSIIVNGVADHVHCFIRLNPDKTISDLAEKLKTSSNHFLKDKKWADGNFSWQKGYGAFSYSKSQMDHVYHYVSNQEIHHKKMTFKKEYTGLLKKSEIEFKDEYLFEFLDDV